MSIVKIDKDFGGANLMIKKRIISCFMLCALMISSIMGFAINSNAADVDSVKSQREDGTYVYYVNTESLLKNAVKSANDGDCILFTHSIICCDNLNIRRNITIDFNIHSLSFAGAFAYRGLVINSNTTLKNGSVYGATNASSAVEAHGDIRLQNMCIFGGDRNSNWGGNGGNGSGIWITRHHIKIYMDNCRIKGGHGYEKSEQTGKAIYCSFYFKNYKIISEGKGYIAVDGIYK